MKCLGWSVRVHYKWPETGPDLFVTETAPAVTENALHGLRARCP